MRDMTSMLMIAGAALAVATSGRASAQTYTEIASFDITDGNGPEGIVQDSVGNLYTPTQAGGSSARLCRTHNASENGTCGTLARIDPSGNIVDLIRFVGTNGGNPVAVVLDGNTLYGSAADGGTHSDGLIYRMALNHPGVTILHQFSGTDGIDPTVLVVAPQTALYGITGFGGTGSTPQGVLFRITTDGTFSVLHNFGDDGIYGCVPDSIVLGPGGVLYGSNQCGSTPGDGGYVFSENPSTGQYSILATFSSTNKGAYDPYVGVVTADGTIYGAANAGGTYGAGTLFSINPTTQPGIVKTLYTFSGGSDGGYPSSGPVLQGNSALIGTASGGTHYAGALYKLDSAGFTVLHVFQDQTATSASDPAFAPLVTAAGTIIGTTGFGGANGYGSAFSYVP
jgi:uncharacterized repeat protein (TIGR03803 family)